MLVEAFKSCFCHRINKQIDQFCESSRATTAQSEVYSVPWTVILVVVETFSFLLWTIHYGGGGGGGGWGFFVK